MRILLKLAGGVLKELINFVAFPLRRWEVSCQQCGSVVRGRSLEGTMIRYSIHAGFSDDHPDGPTEAEFDWGIEHHRPELTEV